MIHFHQILLMIIVVVTSLQCCRVSFCSIYANAKEFDDWKALVVEDGERYRTQIGKLVGEDGGEKKKFPVLEKFRALLDLIKPSTLRRRSLTTSGSQAPWAAPSPSPFQTVVQWSLLRTLQLLSGQSLRIFVVRCLTGLIIHRDNTS
ncbi:hypothetical protein Bca52824_019265 [Brassica carinata]|uniref:Uncharacterized protein n=1 Tax=Brassica carinata TaxID=52824 RepID=A0A8X7VQF8_BRACI|nr:hypothetical protein Bca52824_019265 [Brassica carinata]